MEHTVTSVMYGIGMLPMGRIGAPEPEPVKLPKHRRVAGAPTRRRMRIAARGEFMIVGVAGE